MERFTEGFGKKSSEIVKGTSRLVVGAGASFVADRLRARFAGGWQEKLVRTLESFVSGKTSARK